MSNTFNTARCSIEVAHRAAIGTAVTSTPHISGSVGRVTLSFTPPYSGFTA
jgi:hypothetical protein